MFALIDCNNFYASCEQVFNPRLRKKPLVILSNNDGIVIARSAEAKALGIPMGAAAFKYKELFLKHRVISLSSNYTLYGDMSQRVMNTLEEFGFPIHVYSIDEAFLQLPDLSVSELEEIGSSIKKKVFQWTGLPISIGMACTKTLAKAANKIAKKNSGVLAFGSDMDRHLATFPVEDIWGVGRRYSARLHEQHIHNALQFKNCPDEWIKKHFTVGGLRTAMELRGISCMPWDEDDAPSKTIVSSRSFGKPVSTLQELKESVASHTARAAQKLREQNLNASHLSVFITTNPFGKDPYANSAATRLSPSSFTPDLIHHAHLCLEKIFKEGLVYKKAGILLADLTSNTYEQLDIWSISNNKKEKAMRLLDQINHDFGKKTLHFAAEGIEQPWQMQSSNRTQQFTTSWDEILKVKT